MVEYAHGLDAHLADRLRALRRERGFSLDVLSERCGVSRSMISVVERGESNPTAALLEKLASGLGVTLASLFDPAVPSPPTPLSLRGDQLEWRDPASGYLRRNVSPPGPGAPFRIVEVRFPPGARVAFDNGGRDLEMYQQVWMLEGAMDVTVGGERHELHEGDCLGMRLDKPTMFHNPKRKPARYAVVIASRGQEGE